MPDLLLLSLDTKSFFTLEALAKKHGYRVKSTVDPTLAKEWIQMRQFSVVLIDSNLERSLQQDLAQTLWKASPQAPCVVFDLVNSSEEVAREVKLFGADMASGGNALEAIEQTLKKVKSGTPAPTQLRILVVEDLDSPRDIICFYLESLGLGTVHGVRSGKEALQELEKDPTAYTCVITDIRMPELSGKELIEHIRRTERLRHLPVVALTAYGTVDTLIDCLRAGASGFLVKPPKRDDLTRELGRAMRIISDGRNPRLASTQEAEFLRDLLIEKGFS
jgi:CheY-like chemotaxis protein